MKVFKIGRSSSNDIVVNDAKVSRMHCQIIIDDSGNYQLIDTNSENGTFVNGLRRSEVSLNLSDIVRIGNTTIPWPDYVNRATPSSTHQKNDVLKSGNLGVTSFVCGVAGISLLTFAFGIITEPFVYGIVGTSVLAIVFGIMGWAHDRKNRGLAIAGFILGCVWALACIIWMVVTATSSSSTIVPDIPSYF
jgi:hypothetical protein